MVRTAVGNGLDRSEMSDIHRSKMTKPHITLCLMNIAHDPVYLPKAASTRPYITLAPTP